MPTRHSAGLCACIHFDHALVCQRTTLPPPLPTIAVWGARCLQCSYLVQHQYKTHAWVCLGAHVRYDEIVL